MPRTGSLGRNALIPVAACLAPHSRARPLDGNPVRWGMVPGECGADLPWLRHAPHSQSWRRQRWITSPASGNDGTC
jgi:hypothetical protein